MTEIKEKSFINTYGSDSLDNLIERLQSTSDAKRRYEYILWLGKSLPLLDEDLYLETTKVKGCISEVYVLGILLIFLILYHLNLQYCSLQNFLMIQT